MALSFPVGGMVNQIIEPHIKEVDNGLYKRLKFSYTAFHSCMIDVKKTKKRKLVKSVRRGRGKLAMEEI